MVRGDIYNKLYQTAKAQADFRKVVELEKDEVLPQCIHYAYHYLGDDAKAAEVMENTLLASSDNGDFYDAACLYSVMRQKETALSYLEKSLQMGFRRFEHIERDDDLDNIRTTERFKSLITRYKSIYAQETIEASREFSTPRPRFAIASQEYMPAGSSGGINIDDLRPESSGGFNIDDLKDSANEGVQVLDNAIVEVPPTYPRGETALLEFVNKNVVYPAVAVEQEIQGTVILRFKVDVDGSVSDIKIEKSLSHECDLSAIRVVGKLKGFKPAMQKGKPVPVWFRLPIHFRLP